MTTWRRLKSAVCALAALMLSAVPGAAQIPQPVLQQGQVFGSFYLGARALDLSVTTTTGRVALGANAPVAYVCNTGANVAYVALGDAAVTVTAAAGFPILAGQCASLFSTGATNIAGITAASTTTLQVASGWGAAGATAGASAIPAGSSVIGKVGVDQTTPGTTNGVSLVGVNAATALAGNGVTGTGSPRVTIASDNTPFSVITNNTQWGGTNVVTGGVAGSVGVGGAPNITPTDCSGSITAGGTAQNAFAAGATKRGFTIANLSTDLMWISFNGTAAANTSGSYALNPGSSTTAGGSFITPVGFGMNTALSVVAATTGDKFSCTTW